MLSLFSVKRSGVCLLLLEAWLPAVRPISDSDTTNMQIRMLTQGLGMYSVKRLLMNAQYLQLTPGIE